MAGIPEHGREMHPKLLSEKYKRIDYLEEQVIVGKKILNWISSPNIGIIKSRRMRRAGHVARMGDLVGKPEEKRPLERPKSRWEDNVKMDLLAV